jgi:membrane-bound lytic murein transglycosylase A
MSCYFSKRKRFLVLTCIVTTFIFQGCARWRNSSHPQPSESETVFIKKTYSKPRQNFADWSVPENKIDPKSFNSPSDPQILNFPGTKKNFSSNQESASLILQVPPTFQPKPKKDTSINISDDLNHEGLSQAINNHLEVLADRNPGETLPFGGRQVSIQQITSTLQTFLSLIDQNLTSKELALQVEEKFELVKTGKGKGKDLEALFTGYYTPVITASRYQTAEFKYPIYRKPSQLSKNRQFVRKRSIHRPYSSLEFIDGPNYTREDIDGLKALKDSGLEIAWLNSEMDRYFLHIQGSGLLEFPHGKLQGVQFGGTNGYSYQSVGEKMLKDGALAPSQGSMQGIKKHFNERPQDIPKYLYKNKRYIFFDFSDGTPRGASGTPVIAHRSIATDTSVYPQGGLALISAKKPVLDASGKIVDWKSFSRFVVNQDTGSAIKGLGRVDLYFGKGKRAGQAAGHYMQKGELYFLLLKNKLIDISMLYK